MGYQLKQLIKRSYTEWRAEHIDEHVRGIVPIATRRVLLTKWVAEAHKKISEEPAKITLLFEKTGISAATDGSEDDKINIKG